MEASLPEGWVSGHQPAQPTWLDELLGAAPSLDVSLMKVQAPGMGTTAMVRLVLQATLIEVVGRRDATLDLPINPNQPWVNDDVYRRYADASTVLTELITELGDDEED